MSESRSRTSRRLFAPARAVLWAAVGLILAAAGAHGLDGSFGGSSKTFLAWIYDLAYDGRSAGTASNVVRLNAALYPADRLAFDLAYILYPEIRPDADRPRARRLQVPQGCSMRNLTGGSPHGL